jgi:hypothetical protein
VGWRRWQGRRLVGIEERDLQLPRPHHFIPIPCGRAGPVLNAVLKSGT